MKPYKAAALLAVAGAACTFAMAAPAQATTGAKVFTGAARGLSADVAIQGAIDDAVISASGEQLYTCTPVGEPRIFETFTDPYFGHLFRAEADVSCTP